MLSDVEVSRLRAAVGESPKPLMLTPPAEWTKHALCAEVDGDLWYPEKGQNNSFAKSLCRQCPVRDRCLDEALRVGDLFGIWGGLTATERRGVRRFPRRWTA